MNLPEFKSTLSLNKPPDELSFYLKAMWYDGKENWEKAHNIAQDISDKKGYWIHAYLHRKEGDLWNADYWYQKAGKKMPHHSLEKEWEEIVEAFLE